MLVSILFPRARAFQLSRFVPGIPSEIPLPFSRTKREKEGKKGNEGRKREKKKRELFEDIGTPAVNARKRTSRRVSFRGDNMGC